MKLWLTRGLIASKGFSKILSMGLLGLFFVYLIIIAGTSAIQEKDVGVFFKQIGEEMFKPLQKAQESALEIIDSEKVSLKQSIWKYFSFWSNLYKIYMWLWAIMFFVNFIFKDSNSGLQLTWGDDFNHRRKRQERCSFSGRLLTRSGWAVW